MIDFHKSIRSFLKDKFDLVPDKLGLFEEAFTHSSYKIHDSSARDYEKLELLGDAFVSLIITESLYAENLELKNICNFRKEVVSGVSLSWVSDHLGLDRYIRMGKSCSVTPSIKEDVYESFIAAVYLTFGYDKAKKIVIDTLYKNYVCNNIAHFIDYKTKLQEFVQSEFKEKQLFYVLEKVERMSKEKQVFWSSVNLGEQRLGMGAGTKVKDAEQQAAKAALIKFDKLQ